MTVKRGEDSSLDSTLLFSYNAPRLDSLRWDTDSGAEQLNPSGGWPTQGQTFNVTLEGSSMGVQPFVIVGGETMP